jgi:sugar lactone lactonase YvrE
VTLSSGVYRLDLVTEALTLLCVADPQPGNRGNEARCDANGRLWLGTMQNNIGEQGEDLPITRRSGGLFRIDTDGQVTPLLHGLGIPNTLLWSDDGAHVHFGDSLDGTLYRHAIQADGQLGRPRRGSARTRAAGRTARRWTSKATSGTRVGTAVACCA